MNERKNLDEEINIDNNTIMNNEQIYLDIPIHVDDESGKVKIRAEDVLNIINNRKI